MLWTSRHDGDAFLREEKQAVNIDFQVQEYSTAVLYIPAVSFVPIRLKTEAELSVISGFDRQVDEASTLLGCYATCCVNSLPTFRDSLSVPSSRVKNFSWFLKMRLLG